MGGGKDSKSGSTPVPKRWKDGIGPLPVRHAECPSAASVGITAEPGYSGPAGLVVWEIFAERADQLVGIHPRLADAANLPWTSPRALLQQILPITLGKRIEPA